MFNRKLSKEDIIQEQIDFDQALEQMEIISKLIEHRPIDDEKVIEEIAKLPENNKLINEKALKDNPTYIRFKEKVYEFVLYENMIEKPSICDKHELIKRIVIDKISDDLDRLYSNVPKKFQSKIADVISTGTKSERLLDKELMQLLFQYKYSNDLEDAKEALKAKNSEIEYNKKELKKVKSKLRGLRAKILFFSMLSIPVYLGPIGLGFKLGSDYGKKNSYKQTYTLNDDSHIEIEDMSTVRYYESIPDDYKERKLQYVIEYKETENGKVMVKVYNYNDAIISEDTIQTVKLDEERLVYCNVFKKSYCNKLRPSTFGEYTGEDHRDIVVFENIHSDEEERKLTAMIGLLISLGFELAVLGIMLLLYFGTEEEASFIIPAILHDIDDYKDKRIDKKQLKAKLEGYKQILDDYEEREYARVKSKRLDMIDE